MHNRILSDMDFVSASAGWRWPETNADWLTVTTEGACLCPDPGEAVTLDGAGVHTMNGDTIELYFEPKDASRGTVRFGFHMPSEHAVAELDMGGSMLTLWTSDWTVPQPVATSSIALDSCGVHHLVLEKLEGAGELVKNADLNVYLDGEQYLSVSNVNVLPELGVTIAVKGASVTLKRFLHRGDTPRPPEYLHVGGWQMPRVPSIQENVASIKRGLCQAVERGVQLLVTPETSLTGLFPTDQVTQDPKPIAEGEREVQRFMSGLADAPYLVMGMPEWRHVPGHVRPETRYNVSRVYGPDGGMLSSHAKIHSCETEFWHGYRLQEFDVYGVPVAMHICHDTRYPDVWTLPIMFGARLILHPSAYQRRLREETVAAFEGWAKRASASAHAFVLEVNAAGPTFVAGPRKEGYQQSALLAVCSDCSRENTAFPACSDPQEELVDAVIRVHDAFGYWPVRSFRASEGIAKAYRALYEAWGGQRKTR